MIFYLYYYYYRYVHGFVMFFYAVPFMLLVSTVLTVRKLYESICFAVKDKDPEAVQSKFTASFILKARAQYAERVVKNKKYKIVTRSKIKRAILFRTAFLLCLCIYMFIINNIVLRTAVLSDRFNSEHYRYDLISYQFKEQNPAFPKDDGDDFHNSFFHKTNDDFPKLYFRLTDTSAYYFVLNEVSYPDQSGSAWSMWLRDFNPYIYNDANDTVYAKLKGKHIECVFIDGKAVYYAYGAIQMVFYTNYFSIPAADADWGDAKIYKAYHFAKLDLSTKEVTNVEKEEFEEKYYSVIDNYRLREE